MLHDRLLRLIQAGCAVGDVLNELISVHHLPVSGADYRDITAVNNLADEADGNTGVRVQLFDNVMDPLGGSHSCECHIATPSFDLCGFRPSSLASYHV